MIPVRVGLAALMAAFGASMLTSASCAARPDLAATATPVLFVHGSGMTATTWDSMIEAFVARGYPRAFLFAVQLKPLDGDNVTAAERFIAPAATQLLIDARRFAGDGRLLDKIDIVSHSMGAASSRWYAARLEPQRVRRWISLAGANHGTDRLCGRPGTGDWQMCPAFAANETSSAFQVTLNGTRDAPRDETPYGVGDDLRAGASSIAATQERRIVYCTVRIEPDQWIEPASSAVLDGAGGLPGSLDATIPARETSAGNWLFTGPTDHDRMPQNPRVFDLVFWLLQAPD
jgi:pimeloyl-ACP methyl ester carboxylesterase